ncbi:glycosyltransferase family 2 protein [Neptunicella sp. SCSIO 80796]|uniref:glycosyltransferase family 2 protein n=1 Tax=Neptunicella plasticusilytica TaxID=3117012 RepID=UPI003A4DC873
MNDCFYSSHLYRKNIAVQQNKFALMSAGQQNMQIYLTVLCYQFELDDLHRTIQSVSQLNEQFDQVFLLCPEDIFDQIQLYLKSVFKQDKSVIVTTSLTRMNQKSSFVIFSGEALHANTVKVLRSEINENSDIVYVDTDNLDANQQRCFPEFYPDWNPDLQISTGYINTGVWLKNVNDFANLLGTRFGPAALMEWLTEAYLTQRNYVIQHIAYVLVHRNQKTKSIFNDVSPSFFGMLRQFGNASFVKPQEVIKLAWYVTVPPLVSLIIPTKNAKSLVKACIESILFRSNYANFEILLVDNNSDDPDCIGYFNQLAEHPKVRLLHFPEPFNYSAINNFAVQHANGEIIGLINNDIEVIEPDWLNYMVGHVVRRDIGCVGAKLLFSNNKIQHAGVVLGYGGGAGHAHKFFNHDQAGYLNRLIASHNYSAVTAACLLVKKADYLVVGGLNETDLTVAFNDVDFCLKVMESGKRNLFCAEALLYHHESISRGLEDTPEKVRRFEREVNYLKEKWDKYIQHDPAYNPNLTLNAENFSIRK